jgi:hypothetical protein
MPVIMSIDPGLSGGIAYQDREGNTFAVPMPKGMTEQADLLRALAVDNPGIECVIESVGKHFPGNSGVATATFSRHAGHLEMALYCYGIPTSQVSPQKWMKAVGPFPKDKKERKNAIKEKMSRLYPHLTVTLKTSDALGILSFAMGVQ